MKTLIYLLVLCTLFVSCKKKSKKDAFIINESIYSNFKTGEKDMIDFGGGKFKYWTKDL